jgi:hypothetical protein
MLLLLLFLGAYLLLLLGVYLIAICKLISTGIPTTYGLVKLIVVDYVRKYNSKGNNQ